MIDAEQERNRGTAANRKPPSAAVSRSIDWYAEGQSRMVEIGDVQVFFRFVGKKGRRARIAITAPAGATFCAVDDREKAHGYG